MTRYNPDVKMALLCAFSGVSCELWLGGVAACAHGFCPHGGKEKVSMVQELSHPKTRVVGSKQVLRYAGEFLLKKVFIAKDADETVVARLKEACRAHGIECDMSHTMQQIGSACQIDVGSACAAVRKTPNA